jgi:hypothetical protein
MMSGVFNFEGMEFSCISELDGSDGIADLGPHLKQSMSPPKGFIPAPARAPGIQRGLTSECS